jgi:serine/threonine protein kinase
MSLQPSQRDLLLCVLAREQELVDDRELESAVRECLESPAQPLVDVLATRASLSPSQVAELQAKVDRQGGGPALGGRRGVQLLPPGVQQLFTETVRPDNATNRQAFDTLPHDPTRSAAARARGGMTPGDRFDVLQVHAQGGLGVVFLARDREIDRTVALKQIKSKFADDEDARARFLLEARVTGRLEHPGVAPVYALGSDDTGRPYYAMRLIRGESLLHVIDRFHHGRGAEAHPSQRLPELRKLLQRFLDVCNAVDYAHSKGVIHRDLKPANIMVGKFGETLVVDWGLAKVVGSDEDVALTTRMAPSLPGNSDATETRLGTAIGTPAYMSPEQAAGRIDELGPPTDVYSLGATLYQLLSGCLPHGEEDSIEDSLVKAERGIILPVRERAPWLPRPLAAICMKALAPTPRARYLSAQALAEDIQRWLADEPVKAHREGLLERTFRWTRNHRTLAASLAAGYLVATLAIVAAVIARNYTHEKPPVRPPAIRSAPEEP